MGSRTCRNCGADVSTSAAFCPVCGTDLEARLIELGAATPVRPRRTPRSDRPRRTRLLAGVAAVVVGGLAVSSLVGDDGEGEGEPDGGAAPDATTTTLADLSDRAPLFGEETGLLVVVSGQADVLIDLDSGEVTDLGPFHPSSATGDAFVATSDLGVQLWDRPFQESAAHLLDEAGASEAVLGSSVAWAIDDGEARALRRDGSGEVMSLPLPSGAVPVGTLDDALVLAAPGGTFTVELDGTITALAAGTPVHADQLHVLVASCDDTLTCAVRTVNRDGTVVQTLPLPGSEPVTAASIGPSGHVAWISGAPGSGYVFVDGRSRFPLPSAGTATLDWSPDGRWLVGSFGRSNIWVLDSLAGPDASPEVVELERNVYPEAVFVIGE